MILMKIMILFFLWQFNGMMYLGSVGLNNNFEKYRGYALIVPNSSYLYLCEVVKFLFSGRPSLLFKNCNFIAVGEILLNHCTTRNILWSIATLVTLYWSTVPLETFYYYSTINILINHHITSNILIKPCITSDIISKHCTFSDGLLKHCTTRKNRHYKM